MELHPRRWSEVMESIRLGEIDDGKTLVSLLYADAFLRGR